jgi:hypothetical protein
VPGKKFLFYVTSHCCFLLLLHYLLISILKILSLPFLIFFNHFNVIYNTS